MANQFTKPWLKHEDDIIRNNYGKKSYKDIAKMLPGRSRNAVKIRTQRLNVQLPKDNIWTDDEVQLLKDNYAHNPNITDLLPRREWENIKAKANKMGLKVRYGTYKFDHQFFSNLTEKSAYVAGFIAADGYLNIGDNRLEIGLAKKDEHHLKWIADMMEYTGPIYQKKATNSVRLQITSTKILEDLIEILGVRNNKTLCLESAVIPDRYISHFIRGYIDGDGTIKVNYPTLRILGTKTFLEWIDSKIMEAVKTKDRTPKKKGHENVYIISYNGQEMLDVCKWLYAGSTIHLDRKYQRYVKLLSERTCAKRHTSSKEDDDIVEST